MSDGTAALGATESNGTDERLLQAKEKKEKEYWDNLSPPGVGRSKHDEVESIHLSDGQETVATPSPIKNSDREVVFVNANSILQSPKSWNSDPPKLG